MSTPLSGVINDYLREQFKEELNQFNKNIFTEETTFSLKLSEEIVAGFAIHVYNHRHDISYIVELGEIWLNYKEQDLLSRFIMQMYNYIPTEHIRLILRPDCYLYEDYL